MSIYLLIDIIRAIHDAVAERRLESSTRAVPHPSEGRSQEATTIETAFNEGCNSPRLGKRPLQAFARELAGDGQNPHGTQRRLVVSRSESLPQYFITSRPASGRRGTAIRSEGRPWGRGGWLAMRADSRRGRPPARDRRWPGG